MSQTMLLAIMFVSALTAGVVGAFGAAPALRIGALLLGVAAVGMGEVARRGRSRLVLVALLAAAGLIALLASHLWTSTGPLVMRSLQLGAVLAWVALLLAGVLRLLKVTDDSRGLLLAFSIAIPLVIVDALLPATAVPQRTRWQVNGVSDPVVGFRYAPNSQARNYYPDNPRGYFVRTDPLAETWSLETHEGSEGRMDWQPSAGVMDILRVSISKLVGNQAWHVKLQQAPYQIEQGRQYVVSFRARAAENRPVGCAVGNNHEPWQALGQYHEPQITTEWQIYTCPFTASDSDTNARMFFDLAKSDAAVEFADVVLRDETNGRQVTPSTAAEEYFIDYRFNSLGFRGPDYAIPAPPGTFRILALGDSYTLGVGVKEGDTVTEQLAARLNADAARKVTYEVINAGVSGYNTRNERISYETYSSKYAPQVVLLLMVFNDDLSYQEEQAAGLIPTTTPTKSLSRIADRVASLREPEREYNYTRTIQEMLDLNALVQKRGQKMAVVIFRHSASFPPWMKLVEEVNAGLEGTGTPVLDLGETLLADGRDEMELKVHRVDGHPNEIAHRLAAAEIDRFLRAKGLLPK